MTTDQYESYTFNGLTLDVRTGVYGPADKHAVQETQAYPLILGHYDTVIDAGAHIGSFTVWMKHLVPSVKIVAIEPENSNFNLLSRNAGGLSNVIILHGALTDDDGYVNTLIIDQVNSGGHTMIHSGLPAPHIDVFTLGQIMDDHFGQLSLLKLDIEGCEVDVLLNTPAHVLRRIQCVVGERHVTHEDFQPVIQRLETLGFSVEDKPHPELSGSPWFMSDRGLFTAINQN